MTNNFNFQDRNILAIKTLRQCTINLDDPYANRPHNLAYLVAHLETCLTLDSYKPPVVQLPGGNF